MVVSAFMAMGYNQYKRGHIAVTLFTSQLKETPARSPDQPFHVFHVLLFPRLAGMDLRTAQP